MTGRDDDTGRGSCEEAFDSSSDLHASNYLSISRTEIFTPGGGGDRAAARSFCGLSRDAPSLAVDAAGYVYVARFMMLRQLLSGRDGRRCTVTRR